MADFGLSSDVLFPTSAFSNTAVFDPETIALGEISFDARNALPREAASYDFNPVDFKTSDFGFSSSGVTTFPSFQTPAKPVLPLLPQAEPLRLEKLVLPTRTDWPTIPLPSLAAVAPKEFTFPVWKPAQFDLTAIGSASVTFPTLAASGTIGDTFRAFSVGTSLDGWLDTARTDASAQPTEPILKARDTQPGTVSPTYSFSSEFKLDLSKPFDFGKAAAALPDAALGNRQNVRASSILAGLVIPPAALAPLSLKTDGPTTELRSSRTGAAPGQIDATNPAAENLPLLFTSATSSPDKASSNLKQNKLSQGRPNGQPIIYVIDSFRGDPHGELVAGVIERKTGLTVNRRERGGFSNLASELRLIAKNHQNLDNVYINLSFSVTRENATGPYKAGYNEVKGEIENLINRGAKIFVASGNEYTNYYSTIRGIITVGAEEHAEFPRNSEVDYRRSAYVLPGYRGTSFATPALLADVVNNKLAVSDRNVARDSDDWRGIPLRR